MARLRVPAAQPVSDYDDSGDWFRSVHCLPYVKHGGVVDDSCAAVATSWMPGRLRTAARRGGWMVSACRRGRPFCGGRERFTVPGFRGERKLTELAIRQGLVRPS